MVFLCFVYYSYLFINVLLQILKRTIRIHIRIKTGIKILIDLPLPLLGGLTTGLVIDVLNDLGVLLICCSVGLHEVLFI